MSSDRRPGGRRTGGPPFFDSPRTANRKIPAAMTRQVCFVGESAFFCLLFFTRVLRPKGERPKGASQEK
jgi:hypothetical protein